MPWFLCYFQTTGREEQNVASLFTKSGLDFNMDGSAADRYRYGSDCQRYPRGCAGVGKQPFCAAAGVVSAGGCAAGSGNHFAGLPFFKTDCSAFIRFYGFAAAGGYVFWSCQSRGAALDPDRSGDIPAQRVFQSLYDCLSGCLFG